MANKLRIAFMGTPDFVVPTMQALIDSSHDLVCVYTQPPRAKGRKQQLENTPVHAAAEKAGIEVRHPVNFKEMNDVAAFEALNLDVAVVAAYGMLLPQNILDAPRFGCINIHPSLLPRWRGPSPVQYAIWQGDSKTGVSVMSLEKGMDSGPLLAQEKIAFNPETNFENLNIDLWKKGTKLLNDVLDDLAETGELKQTPQSEEGVTYCKLLTKEQGRVSWSQNAQEIDRQVRGLNPWPGTWCLDAEGKRIKILKAKVSDQTTSEKAGTVLSGGAVVCGGGTALQLLEIQPENKKPMDIKVALNGSHIEIGSVLL